jgi:hypothetical protein
MILPGAGAADDKPIEIQQTIKKMEQRREKTRQEKRRGEEKLV